LEKLHGLQQTCLLGIDFEKTILEGKSTSTIEFARSPYYFFYPHYMPEIMSMRMCLLRAVTSPAVDYTSRHVQLKVILSPWEGTPSRKYTPSLRK